MALWVDLSEFERVFDAISELRDRGSVRVLVSGSGSFPVIQFELVDSSDVEEVLRKFDLTRENFEDGAYDIADAIWALLSNASAEAFASARGDRDLLGEDAEDEQTAADKHKLLLDRLDLGWFRRRWWLKDTTKNPTPSAFSWEVLTKHFDEERDPPTEAPVEFAILSLSADFPDGPGQRLVFMVDADDVDYMIDSLSRLRGQLRIAASSP